MYYAPVKELGEAVLIDPYSYTYTGDPDDTVIMTTVSVPAFADGEFRGAVGFDFSSDFYGRLLSGFRILRTGYAVLAGTDGRIIWHPDPSVIGAIAPLWDSPEAEERMLRLFSEGEPFHVDGVSLITGKPSRMFFFPVECGVGGKRWYFTMVVSIDEITEDADRLALALWVTGSLALVALGIAVYTSARGLSRPIVALSGGAQRMAIGDFPSPVDAKGHDEVAELARSFNTMATRLDGTLRSYERANGELASRNAELSVVKESLSVLNAELEDKVRERTTELSTANAELSDANEELSATLERLKSAQEQAVVSEKFAILGRMSANIAHEVNSPLGAIRSSADLLLDTTRTLVGDLPSSLDSLGPVEREIFERLVAARGAGEANLMGTPDRGARRGLAARFAEAGFENPELVADDFAALGGSVPEATVAAVVAAKRPDIVSMAATVASLVRSGYIIRNATDKASLTLAALSEYSRNGEAEESSVFYPVREIENLLVLYYNQLKRGVEVVRRFDCDEPIFGSRDRINHAWANIINNALRAMDYSGTLEITTRRDGNLILVSFSDSGPGIPETVKPSIFKPFFTTKKPGEGTGLGLSICKGIVEQYGGSIRFESEPGRTTFTVALPGSLPGEGKGGPT